MTKPVTNIVASVMDRLRTVAKQRGQPFDLLLTRYVLERLLYRLGTTTYRDRFILKGAVLMTTWFENPFRPTRDLDLLGFGDSAPEALIAIFKEICAIELADGVTFDSEALAVSRIRDVTEYGGLRLETNAHLGRTKVKVSIDVAFGDATEPGLEERELPVLLDQPAPRLRTYAKETVIAEKFQAMVALGRANSRMKDYYDIWMLAKTHEFTGDGLARAIAATFARRQTEIPETVPDGLSAGFAADRAKQQQWASFAANIGAAPPDLATVIADLAAFLLPHGLEARRIRT
ncbi:MAG: nucleotidyl transferase AbiEii/AbiGii toxin family protein [Bradyrhizobium sp.]|nr:nucleotidyl transferase AbiEii/AbiGii toxin family protein [Bradyrhizobium sp.]